MNLTRLSYFLTAANEMNFTRAAQKLNISQQALSSHIAKLEAYYQVTLFDRGVPMTLTDAGKVLYQSAQEALKVMSDCDRRMQEIRDFTKSTLTVAIPVTRGTMMLPRLCAAFLEMYPQVNLQIIECTTSASVEKALLEGKADLAIGYETHNNANIISKKLYREEYLLLAPNRLLKEHFTSRERMQMLHAPQSLHRFQRCPFIALKHTTMAGIVFDELCREAGFEPHIILTSENILTQVQLCEAGLGVCTVATTFMPKVPILPDSKNHTYGVEQGVTSFKLKTNLGISNICIYRLRTKLLTRAAQEFMELAASIYAQNN